MDDLIRALEEHVPLIIEKRNQNPGSTMTDAELEKELKPIKQIMKSLNPKNLLKLKRVDNGDGPSIGNGIHVEAIHEKIEPPRDGVRYLHIRESHGCFSAGVFVFPPGYEIPLHNHPGMTVLSLVLYGSLKVKTFDIIDDANDDNEDEEKIIKKENDGRYKNHNGCNTGCKVAKLLLPRYFTRNCHPPSKLDTTKPSYLPEGSLHTYENQTTEIKSPTLTELYPHKGNVHHFMAGPHGAAVLDVLVPPYDASEDRDCTFYQRSQEVKCEWDDAEKKYKVWLLPIDQPSWFQCLSGTYMNFCDRDNNGNQDEYSDEKNDEEDDEGDVQMDR
eukprot:CAMPEP_0204618946 /NCGR_PEP_ID=MMETSP0717-20131115/5449_1 /ASSEMBLY_ACC=CAM_ASM_000666 /TAXON_ID=230516 /ORGANISM="Chaetoceros curvisetus" /LENGTH=329 /DNA_ID=CAMNT_0051632813 /DNA_START=1 /DNA_END=990 /DNA_ORIENTATION=-